VCAFKTSEQWAEDSHKLLDSILGVANAPPPVAIEAGASFLYWICSVERVAMLYSSLYVH